jgi:hypothetical protein
MLRIIAERKFREDGPLAHHHCLLDCYSDHLLILNAEGLLARSGVLKLTRNQLTNIAAAECRKKGAQVLHCR